MKVIVVLCLAFAFVQVQGKAVDTNEDEPFEPEEEECITELKLNRAEIKVLNEKEVAPEDNEKFNEFIGCYWHKQGWQDGDGLIDFEKLRKSMKKLLRDELTGEGPLVVKMVLQMVSNSIEQCETNPPAEGTSHGQTAVKVQNCIVSKLHEIINE